MAERCTLALWLCGPVLVAGCLPTEVVSHHLTGQSGDLDTLAGLFVAANGDDAGDCSREAPCASFRRAYLVATPGQVVEVAAGSYGDQTIPGTPDRSEPRVSFRPAAGADVKLGDLLVEGLHVELQGFTTSVLRTTETAKDVVFRDDDAGDLDLEGGTAVSILGGTIGPGVDFSPWVLAASGSTVPPTDILIEGVLFHDWTRTTTSIDVSCLRVLSGERVTVRGNRFKGCAVQGIALLTLGAAGPPHDVLIENNFFDVGAGTFAIYVGDGDAVTVRHNSALQPIFVEATAPAGAVVAANVAPLPAWGCTAGAVYRNNLWDGASCDATDLDVPLQFKDASSFDLHLADGATAIDRGSFSDMPATDIDGDVRPLGAAPDCGADEAR